MEGLPYMKKKIFSLYRNASGTWHKFKNFLVLKINYIFLRYITIIQRLKVKPYINILKAIKSVLIIFGLIKLVLFLYTGDTQFIKNSIFVIISIIISIEEVYGFLHFVEGYNIEKNNFKVYPKIIQPKLDSSISAMEVPRK